MSEDVLLENVITRRGLRRVHVMRLGERIDREAWIERAVPGEALEYLSAFERYDVDVQLWHLQLAWNARELVVCEAGEVMLWWPGRALSGDGLASVREAIDLASWKYWLCKNKKPGKAWMKRLPKGATQEVEVADLHARLALMETAWVPDKYVAVGE